MVYHAKTQRLVLLVLFILTVGFMFPNWDEPETFYFLIPFSIYIITIIFMQFNFKIADEALTFHVLIFSLTIYRKEVHYNEICGIKFKRVGWGKKCAIVQNKNGFNFRIINFNSEKIFEDLIEFSKLHQVPISKTSDYFILEK
ncbi:hypothetical protein [Ornithinibacillus californiensis]|uniref:hypothetical protein n=1 Tax=Ornithinibacillus californiensis TaxID=161536 RepID=UPI00064E1025|nr:hypothetical protein [Ornithinibacillus californiensis]